MDSTQHRGRGHEDGRATSQKHNKEDEMHCDRGRKRPAPTPVLTQGSRLEDVPLIGHETLDEQPSKASHGKGSKSSVFLGVIADLWGTSRTRRSLNHRDVLGISLSIGLFATVNLVSSGLAGGPLEGFPPQRTD